MNSRWRPPAAAVLAGAAVTGLTLWSWQSMVATVLVIVVSDIVADRLRGRRVRR